VIAASKEPLVQRIGSPATPARASSLHVRTRAGGRASTGSLQVARLAVANHTRRWWKDALVALYASRLLLRFGPARVRDDGRAADLGVCAVLSPHWGAFGVDLDDPAGQRTPSVMHRAAPSIARRAGGPALDSDRRAAISLCRVAPAGALRDRAMRGRASIMRVPVGLRYVFGATEHQIHGSRSATASSRS
jgi:hypothetical protein